MKSAACCMFQLLLAAFLATSLLHLQRVNAKECKTTECRQGGDCANCTSAKNSEDRHTNQSSSENEQLSRDSNPDGSLASHPNLVSGTFFASRCTWASSWIPWTKWKSCGFFCALTSCKAAVFRRDSARDSDIWTLVD
uniref:Putative secreted protein n=1 Tax=Amblyomma triste TaxID=251400 RepID=A0A023G0Z9_AMBTT